MTPTLVGYRLRPVPWGWLAALSAGWLLFAWALVGIPDDPGMGVAALRLAAFLLGVAGAVLAAPETDPPRDLLRAAPVPRWRSLALRLVGWLALGAAPILALAVLLDGTGGWAAADLVRGALPNYLLVTSAGFLAAGMTSVLGGGAVALAAVFACHLAGRIWPAWWPIQLGSVPGAPQWAVSRAWMVAVSLALVAAALLLEARAGARVGPPRRRRSARPRQASQARARP